MGQCLNVMMSQCFWCGGEKNELAIDKKLIDCKDRKMKAVLNYDPCDKCKEQWDKGTAIIEVRENLDNPPILDNLCPTGKLIVIKKEACMKIFNMDKEQPIIFIDDLTKMLNDLGLNDE